VYCIQASIPSIYKDTYGFDEFKLGLSGRFGVILGGFANGKIMDQIDRQGDRGFSR
jgi:hypothetical protein